MHQCQSTGVCCHQAVQVRLKGMCNCNDMVGVHVWRWCELQFDARHQAAPCICISAFMQIATWTLAPREDNLPIVSNGRSGSTGSRYGGTLRSLPLQQGPAYTLLHLPTRAHS